MRKLAVILTVGWLTLWELFPPRGVSAASAERSTDVRIILEDALWKSREDKITYQDLTIDLVCNNNNCQEEVWGFAPNFNQSDHQGIVTVKEKDNNWSLEINLTIAPDPWRSLVGEAKYAIALRQENDRLIGSYSGNFNQQQLEGKVTGIIADELWPRQIPDHEPIEPREHPRLIFRRQQLPALREKATTPMGRAILTQLHNALNQEVEYGGYVPNGGYHAAGHCFLSLLNQEPEAAETAWQIVEKSINNPGPRLLEQSPIVAGVALAYDLCYDAWNEERLSTITNWLGQQTELLIKGTKGGGWNAASWSNWSSWARGAAGLAALAIMAEPTEFFSEPTDTRRALKIAERNIKRYLNIGIGDRGFGTEGDHYTTKPWSYSVLPFLQAYENVLGKDLVTGSSSAEWLLAHYVFRSIPQGGYLSVPSYGRHRKGPRASVLAVGWESLPQRFLPAAMWLFERYLASDTQEQPTFGIQDPHDAIFALAGAPQGAKISNPADVFGRVLADEQKGFYAFRNWWRNEKDFVASIYLKREVLRSSWSFPEAGSFRIWGLGGRWAAAGPGDGKRESENVVVVENTPAWGDAQPIFFEAGSMSAVVSMNMDNVYRQEKEPPVGIKSLRSFAVDYSGVSGVAGLFAVVDKFVGGEKKTWTMHTQEENVEIDKEGFTIKAESGATMRGIFVAPAEVEVSFVKREGGGIITATGGDEFFVVMMVQKGFMPEVKIIRRADETPTTAKVRIGRRVVSFRGDRIFLD